MEIHDYIQKTINNLLNRHAIRLGRIGVGITKNVQLNMNITAKYTPLGVSNIYTYVAPYRR